MNKQITQRDSFWNKVYDLASKDRDIVIVTADMGAPALDKFRKDMAAQFVNVGIAEQNCMLIAMGLAMTGKKVFTYAIAPFITLRCLEQIRVNTSIMKTPITIVGVGAGFGYEDSGPTHHIIEDIAIMRALPEVTIHSISDSPMASRVAEISAQLKTSNYVRLDRLVLPDLYDKNETFDQGFSILRKGRSTLLATGSMVHLALEVAKKCDPSGKEIGVIDVYRLPINAAELGLVLKSAERIMTLEEHFLPGGFGSAVLEVLADQQIQLPVKRLGIEHAQGYCYEYGGRNIIRKHYGIDLETLSDKVEKYTQGVKELDKVLK